MACFFLFASGCDGCSETGTTPCQTNTECTGGEICLDGLCRLPTDGGADGGVPCTDNTDCNGDVCQAGKCCAEAKVCGSSCCGASETCFADQCVIPGEVCTSKADCQPDEYCEQSFPNDDTPRDPEESRVCIGERIRTGRCLPTPRRCEAGETPGPEDNCILECEFRPDVAPLDAVQQWRWGPENARQFPNKTDIWSTPVVGRVYDTNCDGRVDEDDPPTIVVVSGNVKETCCHCTGSNDCATGVLRAIDGRTGAELWSLHKTTASSRGISGVSPALGDLDRDGFLEVVAVDGERRVIVVQWDGQLLARSAEALPNAFTGADVEVFGWGGGLALGDMEGDGTVEIAYGSTVFRYDRGTLTRRFAGSSRDGGGGHVALSTFVDLNNDGDLELLAGRAAYEADGTEIWRTKGIGNPFPGVGDFDGDGTPEIVAVRAGQVRILSPLDGSVLLGPTALGASGSGGPPTVADFDGDGDPEIGIAQKDNYFMVEVDLARKQLDVAWTAPNHDFSSSVTGSTVFDFEGDGVAEVVYADECFLWVYDGPTGAVRFATPTTSFTGTEASLVADVDGDGRAEIVMVSNGASPDNWKCTLPEWLAADGLRPGWTPPAGQTAWRGLTVFRDRANGWVGTRTLWNQHTYHVSNVCDDRDTACRSGESYGSIPRMPRANWSLPWLNNFRQNVQDEGLFDAPDATVSLSAQCGPPLVLTASLRNLGEAPLPAGVPVEFFKGGPSGLQSLGIVTSDVVVPPGQVTQLRLQLPAGATEGDSFTAEVIQPASGRIFRECREDNNRSAATQAICLI